MHKPTYHQLEHGTCMGFDPGLAVYQLGLPYGMVEEGDCLWGDLPTSTYIPGGDHRGGHRPVEVTWSKR
jgi:hypothetical protein